VLEMGGRGNTFTSMLRTAVLLFLLRTPMFVGVATAAAVESLPTTMTSHTSPGENYDNQGMKSAHNLVGEPPAFESDLERRQRVWEDEKSLLAKKLQVAQLERDQAVSQNRDLLTTIQSLKTLLEHSEATNADTEDRIAQAVQGSRVAAARQASKTIQSLETRLEKLLTSYSELKDQSGTLTETLKQANARLVSVEQERETLQASVSRWEANVQILEMERAQIPSTLVGLNVSDSSVKGVQEHCSATMLAEKQTLELALANETKRVQELESQLEQAKVEQHELENTSMSFRSKMQKMEFLNDKLTAQWEESNAVAAQVDASQITLELEHVQERIQQLLQEKNALKTEVADLHRQLNNTKADSERAAQHLQTSKDLADSLTIQLAEAVTELDFVEASTKQAANEKIAAIQSRYWTRTTELRERSDSLSVELATAKLHLRQVKRTLFEVRRELFESNEKLRDRHRWKQNAWTRVRIATHVIQIPYEHLWRYFEPSYVQYVSPVLEQLQYFWQRLQVHAWPMLGLLANLGRELWVEIPILWSRACAEFRLVVPKVAESLAPLGNRAQQTWGYFRSLCQHVLDRVLPHHIVFNFIPYMDTIREKLSPLTARIGEAWDLFRSFCKQHVYDRFLLRHIVSELRPFVHTLREHLMLLWDCAEHAWESFCLLCKRQIFDRFAPKFVELHNIDWYGWRYRVQDKLVNGIRVVADTLLTYCKLSDAPQPFVHAVRYIRDDPEWSIVVIESLVLVAAVLALTRPLSWRWRSRVVKLEAKPRRGWF
jgi:phage shock protein A